MVVVGVDPGRTGAAAVLGAEGDLVAVHSWRPRQRAGQKVLMLDGEIVCATSACLGDQLARLIMPHQPERLWCESQYLNANARTGLTLSRSAGMVCGPMLAAMAAAADGDASGLVRWVTPSAWRKAAFGKQPRRNRDSWKEKATAAVANKYAASLTSDECEAICIAYAALSLGVFLE